MATRGIFAGAMLAAALAVPAMPAPGNKPMMRPEPPVFISYEERCTIAAGLVQRARVAHDKGKPEEVYLKEIAEGRLTSEIPDAKFMETIRTTADWAYGAPAGGTPELVGSYYRKGCLASPHSAGK